MAVNTCEYVVGVVRRGFFFSGKQMSFLATNSFLINRKLRAHTKIMFSSVVLFCVSSYIVPYSQNLSLIFISLAYKKRLEK